MASATDQKVTGPRSIKLTSTGNTLAKISNGGILADAGRRISFRMRMDALPSGNVKSITGIYGASEGGGFMINTDGTVSIYNSSYSAVATGSKVLAVNTWYRFCLTYTITDSTHKTFTVFIDGTQEVTASNFAGAASCTLLYTQHTYNNGANTQNVWYDDFFIDDGTSGDTGDVHVTNKRPNANGTTNGFTTQIGAGGSGYGSGHSPQVNEQPLSVTNGWAMVGAGSAVTEEYTVENASTGDVDITGATILGLNGWVYAKSLASETGSIVVVGSAGNISLTSTTTLFTGPITTASYPGGGTDIGIITTTALTTVSLYECGILICYLPAVVSTTKTLAALGVG